MFRASKHSRELMLESIMMPDSPDPASDSDSLPASMVDRIRAGDRDAMAEVIEWSERRLLAFIDRSMSTVLRKRIEPVDVLQDVALRATESIDELADPCIDVMSWLFRQCERRIIDAHRKYVAAQKRDVRREIGEAGASGDTSGGFIDLLAASLTTPSQAFVRDVRMAKIREALTSLPSKAQEAIRLRYLENRSVADVADQIGKTVGATRVLLSRSLKRLMEQLTYDEDFASLAARNGKVPPDQEDKVDRPQD